MMSQLCPPCAGLEEHVRAEIKNMRIDRREQQRHGANEAIFAAAADWADVLHLAGSSIEARHLAAVDNIGIQRIGRDVAVFFDAHRMPVAKRDLAIVAAAGNARGAALLLPAVDPIRKAIVGDHVIELRGRLVVPGAPGCAAIDRDGGALIGSPAG